jgi:hypothetical protein
MNSRPKERQSILLQKKWSWSHSNLLKVWRLTYYLLKHAWYWCIVGNDKSTQREDDQGVSKKSKLASNSPDTDNKESGRKHSLPNFGEASFVFDKHIDWWLWQFRTKHYIQWYWVPRRGWV